MVIIGIQHYKISLLAYFDATDEEKAARSAAIQEATKYAALVPMQVARNSWLTTSNTSFSRSQARRSSLSASA